MGRMLLSHNYNLNNSELPVLNREEFAQIFIEGLQEQPHIRCSLISNPHWIVEIVFPIADFEAKTIGQLCGEILTNKRQSQLGNLLTTDTLILGGKKTTPVTSASPTSLQTGEWGVDVVETAQAEAFLDAINWDAMTAAKPSDGIFKIEFITSK